jgi:hypothetical protein
MHTYYKIQAKYIFFPFFWFNINDREWKYFCKAYTEMKMLRGIPKVKRRVIPESECVLRLMEDEDEK